MRGAGITQASTWRTPTSEPPTKVKKAHRLHTQHCHLREDDPGEHQDEHQCQAQQQGGQAHRVSRDHSAGVTGRPPPAALVLVCTPVFGALGIALSPPPGALALGVGVSPVLSFVLTPRAPSLVHTLSPRAPFLIHVPSLCALGLVRAPVPRVLHLVRALTPCAPGLVGTMTPCASSLVHPSDDVLASCSKPPALAL